MNQRLLPTISREVKQYISCLESQIALLQQQECFFEGVLNSLSTHIAVLNEDGMIVAVNEAWRKFAYQNNYMGSSYGINTNYLKVCEEAEGEGAAEAQAVLLGLQAVLREEMSHFYFEYPCHSPIERRWFAIRASRFDKFNERYVVVSHENITQRKVTELELQQSEAELRIIIEAAVDSLIIIDEYGIIKSVNLATERIFGYSSYDLINRSINILMPSPYREHHDGYLAHYRATGEAKIIGIGRETVGQRRNGSIFPIELSVSEVRLGERRLFAGIIRDITRRKETESQLQTYRDHLEELVKARTAELETANQELRDFAYVASHDLKAPLRAISSLSSWLASDYQDKLDETGQQLLQLLNGRTKRMEGLIEGILQYSRLGRMREEQTWVDIQLLIANVVDLLAPPSHISVEIKTPLPIIKGEKTRIEQLFQNIISNAIKFMDKAVGKIEVSCIAKDNYWQFSVADNGPGIDHKYFDKIFQIFQTLNARDQFESSGIGLALVKKIVELYGGQVWLESELGSGATFFFTLPR